MRYILKTGPVSLAPGEKVRCTCLHLSSAPFLSPSACSARSIAFSLSSFSICIFFLMASIFLQVVFSARGEVCSVIRTETERQRSGTGTEVDRSARAACLSGSGRTQGWSSSCTSPRPFFQRGSARGRCPYLGSESCPVCA